MESHEQTPPAEFVATRPEELVDFYLNVFGYRVLEYDPESSSWIIDRRSAFGTRASRRDLVKAVSEKTSSIIGTFRVDDLEETTQKVMDNGGYIPDLGGGDNVIEIGRDSKMSFFCDPQGNMFGVVQHTDLFKE